MPQDSLNALADLVEAGLAAAGSRMSVTRDDGAVVVRDVFVELGPAGFEVRRVTDHDEPFMTFPETSLAGAASAVCMAVLGSVVSRAVEMAAERRD